MKKIIFTAIALVAVLIAGTSATFAAGNGQKIRASKNYNEYCVNRAECPAVTERPINCKFRADDNAENAEVGNGECVRDPENCPNDGECPNNGERPLDGTGCQKGRGAGQGGKGCRRNR